MIGAGKTGSLVRTCKNWLVQVSFDLKKADGEVAVTFTGARLRVVERRWMRKDDERNFYTVCESEG